MPADSIDTLIKLLGGSSYVARQLRIKQASTVSSWQTRNRIPAWRWASIVGLAQRSGKARVSLNKLAELHARVRPRAA